MIEVFKTNVTSAPLAALLVYEINQEFPACRANFDLQDCDRILRVVSADGSVPVNRIIDLLRAHGFYAEPLSDEEPPVRPVTAFAGRELTFLGPFRERHLSCLSRRLAGSE